MLGFDITAPPSRLVGRTNHSILPNRPHAAHRDVADWGGR